MAWDFETDPEYQEKLDWADEFVREEVEPLDLVFPAPEQFTPLDETKRKIIDPLKEEVRRQGLWATHLGPELGGQGYGQLKLALLNEILGRSPWAPIVFGCQAPDTGNAEIIAHYGTPEQKERYLQPLLDGELLLVLLDDRAARRAPTRPCSRHEAVKDGDEWVINGWKFFSSNAKTASFLIVMAVTNPDVSAYKGMSMFLVPTDTPGVNIVRNVGLSGEPLNEGSHALIHYEDVRVPDEALLGGEGQAFAIAQTRLGGGRIHHAMRTIGMAQKALDMMCERALSRETQGSLLADKQFVQGYIADSYAQLVQFRLFVLYTAWEIDKYNDYSKVRKDIATAKVVMPTVLHDIAWRAMQVHGALGVTNEMPFFGMIHGAGVMGLADGPTEVHKVTVARQVLRDYRPSDDMWPTQWLPKKLDDGQGEVRRVPRARGGEPVIDIDRLAERGWTSDGLPGKGEPIEQRYISGGIARTRSTRSAAATLHGAMRIPPPTAPASRDDGILREWRIIEALDGTDVPHTAAHRGVHATPSVLGRTFYLMGFVDGWSPMEHRRPLARAVRHRPRRPQGPRLPAGRGHRPAVQGRLAGQGPGGPRPARRLPRAPGRPVDGLPRAHQGPRAARASTGRRRGCATHRPIDFIPGLMHGDYQFANVMFKHGAPARLAAIVDWEMGTVGDPKLDLAWVVQRWPEDTNDPPSTGARLRRHERHADDGPDWCSTTPKVSGRQVDDIDYYVVLAKWKLGDRARAGLPAGRRRREAAGVRPDRRST